MANHSEHDYVGHIIPTKFYVLIWAILMVLTATTVYAATVELGVFNIVVALVIATIKGTPGRALFHAPALQHQTDDGDPDRIPLLVVHPVFADHDGLHLARLVHLHRALIRSFLACFSSRMGAKSGAIRAETGLVWEMLPPSHSRVGAPQLSSQFYFGSSD